MNLTRCNHGHFYDMDKFESCPHCKNNGAGAAAEATVGLTGGTAGATEPYSGNAGDVTVPVGMTSPLDEVNTGFGKPIDATEEKTEAAFQKISNPNPFAPAKNPGFQNFAGDVRSVPPQDPAVTATQLRARSFGSDPPRTRRYEQRNPHCHGVLPPRGGSVAGACVRARSACAST